MAVATAVLLSVLVFLYAKTQSFGESDYFGNVALLRHLKQLDAEWELDVLKSRVGINTHYDPLADSLTELSRLLEQLKADMETQKHDEAAVLAEGRAALLRDIQEKAALIEQFKSNNSVLRNSLIFLPTAAADVEQSIGKTSESARSAARRTLISVNKLLLASMLYSQSASDDRGSEIQNELSRLEAGSHVFPSDTREKLDIFGAHVRTILREQKVVNQLLGSITVVPTATRIDEISNALTVEHQRAEVQSGQHREYLLIFSVVLVALLLYAAARLVRSHAVINRVNKELHGANENLEQRVQELHEMQSELVATARKAGMAEMATNVLHNVGNILNGVNVSADLVSSTLRTSRAQGLTRAVQLMDEHAADLGDFLTLDDKGRMLPGYLSRIAQTLAQEQQGMIEELGHLTRSIDHIKDVVATQQSYAGGSSLVVPVQICDLAEDALRMNGGALARHQVTVVKEFAQVPVVRLDRARVLQILVNLISNAKNAMASMAGGSHQITLRVDVVAGSHLRVSVKDEGEGIPEENLTRIFAHGFTTRKAGHGFGLHSCALAARQMGGTLTAHSDGPGKGATFTLELPINTAPGAP
ncbi:DAHL domain-containing protein [Polaromonas jejuensis]|uniref:histidine kinase n=1 Tax=Polaromonas jejuensis TaxID=457502 RepID=A0ABW0QEP7_9BURK|nr:DAHL domain-containing protein [Polaromonas jejuensis]